MEGAQYLRIHASGHRTFTFGDGRRRQKLECYLKQLISSPVESVHLAYVVLTNRMMDVDKKAMFMEGLKTVI